LKWGNTSSNNKTLNAREGGAFLNMVFLNTMLTTADVNIHALIAKYGIDIQIVSPEIISNSYNEMFEA
jgi:hypothetical protein